MTIILVKFLNEDQIEHDKKIDLKKEKVKGNNLL
jgi:hypothetical protein